MRVGELELLPERGGAALTYQGQPMATELGAGAFLGDQWRWSFDSSLTLESTEEGEGDDFLGYFVSLSLTYADWDGHLLRQRIKAYRDRSVVIVETEALRDLQGTAVQDSFFHTTFNAPVMVPAPGLRYLAYTWGLEGGEGTGIGGHFPDAALASNLDDLPEQLRLADFSPTSDVHQSPQKPFAPLAAYDDMERTLVMSPLNHFLISPMSLTPTARGTGIARGLHGSIGYIPLGTTTRTVLVFGQGLAATLGKWGDLLLELGGKGRSAGQDSSLARSLGFWNCYGGYYADLFRPTDAGTLTGLARYFREEDIPVRYFGLDLWYLYDQVGFARSYRPHPEKYPKGLESVYRETGLPFLLHMSAFDPDNEYLSSYEFAVEDGSAYPTGPEFYRDRAREFRQWGAMGIWPDFLRTQLQNCPSLRRNIGEADRLFSNLCRAMAEEGLDVMLCMPTVGHYLASTQHHNVIAARTSTDYVNHQPGQLEALSHLDEYRTGNSAQRNLRQNLFVSLLAWSLGLAPSYDVFISNGEHPEGFADPNVAREALGRALSAGIVGVGDKVGHLDKDVAARLAFPDGTLSQPDHPPWPVVATLTSPVPAFYTTTTIGGFTWTYLALFNLAEGPQDYRMDLGPFLPPGGVVYDYLAGERLDSQWISGRADEGDFRYLVIAPRLAGAYLLGFADKYVPVSRRQVKDLTARGNSADLALALPPGREYAIALIGGQGLQASGEGLEVLGVETQEGMTRIRFRVDTEQCRLMLQG